MICTIKEVSILINLSETSLYNITKSKEFKNQILKRENINSHENYKMDLNDNNIYDDIATDTDYINYLKDKIKVLKERLAVEQNLYSDRIFIAKTDKLEKGCTKIIINKNIKILIEQGETEKMAKKIAMMYIHEQRKTLIKETKLV